MRVILALPFLLARSFCRALHMVLELVKICKLVDEVKKFLAGLLAGNA